jgi:hypothetical protein
VTKFHKPLLWFRNKRLAVVIKTGISYNFCYIRGGMSPRDPTRLDAPGKKDDRTRGQYQPPALKKRSLAEVLKSFECNPSANDPVVREQIEEFRLLFEQRDLHELNNDLAIIVGECDLLSDLLEKADAQARVRVIKTTANRIAEKISAHPSPVAVTRHDAK